MPSHPPGVSTHWHLMVTPRWLGRIRISDGVNQTLGWLLSAQQALIPTSPPFSFIMLVLSGSQSSLHTVLDSTPRWCVFGEKAPQCVFSIPLAGKCWDPHSLLLLYCLSCLSAHVVRKVHFFCFGLHGVSLYGLIPQEVEPRLISECHPSSGDTM